MRINLITDLRNTVGLGREIKMYTELFEGLGHAVTQVQWDQPYNIKRADINLFDELVNVALLNLADRNWVMPHAEYWRDEWTPFLPFFDRVICKTQDCLGVFSKLVAYPYQCHYTENMSRDMYDPTIEKERSLSATTSPAVSGL